MRERSGEMTMVTGNRLVGKIWRIKLNSLPWSSTAGNW